MGLFSFRRNTTINAKDEIRVSARKSINEMMKIVANGGSKEEAYETLMRPDNYYVCIGSLAQSAVRILPIILGTIVGNEHVEKMGKSRWKEFVLQQKYCDEFFFGNEMRVYVIAQAWKQELSSWSWEDIDAIFQLVGTDIDIYRKEDWWRVACFTYLAEQGHENREDFQSAWTSMTGDERLAHARSLSEEEFKHFVLME